MQTNQFFANIKKIKTHCNLTIKNLFQYAFPHLDRAIENWLNDLFSLQAFTGASIAHNFLVGYK